MNDEVHEEIEGHEDDTVLGKQSDPYSNHRMRLASPLSPETERVMTETIGAAIAVHRVLGPGFMEAIYRKAMCIELQSRGIAFETERPITVKYRSVDLPGQRIDLIVGNAIVVELKAVVRLDEVHRAQLISYLKSMGLRGGLLINFRVDRLQQGLKRVVL
jgi:GxxExxY protein